MTFAPGVDSDTINHLTASIADDRGTTIRGFDVVSNKSLERAGIALYLKGAQGEASIEIRRTSGTAKEITVEVTGQYLQPAPGADGGSPADGGSERDGARSADGAASIEATPPPPAPRPVVSRKVRVPFVPGETTRVHLELSYLCAAHACDEGESCVPYRGCQPIGVGAGYDDRSMPPDDSASCRCDSLFPFCLKASWTLMVCNADATVNPPKPDVTADRRCPIKTSVIADHRGNIFEQVKIAASAPIQLDRKLLSRDDTVEAGGTGARGAGPHLFWVREDNFDDFWQPTMSSAYNPSKLRLDQTRTQVGETWTETFLEVSEVSGAASSVPPDVIRHDVRWAVVPLDFRLPPPARDGTRIRDSLRAPFRGGFIARKAPEGVGLDELGIVCHLRDDDKYNAATGAPLLSEEKIFCFVAGVGKIWEFAGLKGQEFLLDYSIPGCPRL